MSFDEVGLKTTFPYTLEGCRKVLISKGENKNAESTTADDGHNRIYFEDYSQPDPLAAKS
jgi:hypothetical protein